MLYWGLFSVINGYFDYAINTAAKTLARKYDISMKKVFDKLGSQLHVNYKSSSGKAQKIQLALYPNFKRKPRHFYALLNASKIPFAPRYNSQNPTKKPCTLCGSIEHIQMFHRKTISRLKSPYSEIVDYMVRINRRQIPVCSNCYKSLCTS